jgi:hypothetical protein
VKKEFFRDPETSTEIPKEPKYALEEYKILVEEARFTMTRYMQMFALYIILISLFTGELIKASELSVMILITSSVTILNIAVFYGAIWFRSMAYHNLNRLVLLSEYFHMQKPHPMDWGYRGGVTAIVAVQVVAIGSLIWFITAH